MSHYQSPTYYGEGVGGMGTQQPFAQPQYGVPGSAYPSFGRPITQAAGRSGLGLYDAPHTEPIRGDINTMRTAGLGDMSGIPGFGPSKNMMGAQPMHHGRAGVQPMGVFSPLPHASSPQGLMMPNRPDMQSHQQAGTPALNLGMSPIPPTPSSVLGDGTRVGQPNTIGSAFNYSNYATPMGPVMNTPATGPSVNQTDPLEGVKKAAKLVTEFQLRDERKLDLRDLLRNDTSSGVAAYESPEEMSKQGLTPRFRRLQTVSLPQVLLEQYNRLQCKCFMGLFPEINRSWVTIDNQLFLWNYSDGSDFCVYDGLDQIIVSVALVRPRANVFVQGIQHLLVITTPVDIVILAVTFRGNELTLVPTEFTIPTDNVLMLKVLGLENGRVFMAGRDGCLYELSYQAEDTWFQRKCRKLNHTQGPLSTVVPSFLKFGKTEAIRDMAVDNSRNILYTLSGDSVIEVYDLGKDADSITKVASANGATIAKQAMRACPNTPAGEKFDARTLKIIHMSPISKAESTSIHLVAVNTTGVRLYFSTVQESGYYGSSSSRPSSVNLLYVRFPPQAQRGVSQSYRGHAYVHTAFYGDGVYVMADSRTDGADSIITTCPEITASLRGMRGGLRETYIEDDIQGRAWSISETLPRWFQASSAFVLLQASGSAAGLHVYNELATQHILPPREFLVLTNSGLHRLVKERPVDQLERVLQDDADRERALVAFVRQYGEEQTTAMLLMLACNRSSQVYVPDVSDPSPATLTKLGNGPPSDTSTMISRRNPRVHTIARDTFFRIGGQLPTHDDGTNGLVRTDSSNNMGRPTAVPTERHSACHDGLVLYLSRLLRPCWANSIVVSRDGTQYQRCAFTKEDLQLMLDPLQALKQFLDDHPQLKAAPHDMSKPQNMRQRLFQFYNTPHLERAKRQEQQSILDVYCLVIRCIEAMCLLNVMCDHQFPRLIAQLPTDTATSLARLSFRDLVTSDEGRHISRCLIAVLMASFRADEGKVERMCDLLEAQCPGFFTESDVLGYRARDLVEKAKLAGSPQQRQNYLKQSLELYKRIIHYTNVKEVVVDYIQLNYHLGAVELAIARLESPVSSASHTTRMAAGLAALGDPGDSQRNHERIVADCHECICTYVLGELAMGFNAGVADKLMGTSGGVEAPRQELSGEERQRLRIQVLERVFKSNDRGLHAVVYLWYLQQQDHRLHRDLIEIPDPPGLESFLKREAFSLNKEALDLLCQFYDRHENHADAAEVLSMLALRDAPDEMSGASLSFEKRMEYLSKSISYAKSSRSMDLSKTAQHRSVRGAFDGTRLQELQEKLEVAQIQRKVLKELQAKTNQTPEIVASIEDIQCRLLNISDLYNKFANRHGLWESCLAILHCSGHQDTSVVLRIWKELIGQEISKGVDDLQAKVTSLGRTYFPSDIIFPIGFLCETLEVLSGETGNGSSTWVADVMLQVGVPVSSLFDVYHSLVHNQKRSKNQLVQLLDRIHYIITIWMKENTPPYDHQRLLHDPVDTRIDEYMVMLHSSSVAGAQLAYDKLNKLRDSLEVWKRVNLLR